jgi:hypothetical protein
MIIPIPMQTAEMLPATEGPYLSWIFPPGIMSRAKIKIHNDAGLEACSAVRAPAQPWAFK